MPSYTPEEQALLDKYSKYSDEELELLAKYEQFSDAELQDMSQPTQDFFSMDTAKDVAKGVMGGLGQIGMNIGRFDIAPTVDDIAEGAPKVFSKGGETIMQTLEALASPIDTATQLKDTLKNPEALAGAISGTFDFKNRTKEGDLLGMGLDFAPIPVAKGAGAVLRKAGNTKPVQAVRNAPKNLIESLANTGLGSKGGAKAVFNQIKDIAKSPERLKSLENTTAGSGSLNDLKRTVESHMKDKNIEINEMYGKQLDEIITANGDAVVDVDSMVDDLINGLERDYDLKVEPNKIVREPITPDGVKMTRQTSEPGDVDFDDFDSLVGGDRTVANLVVDELQKLKQSPGTLSNVSKTLKRIKSITEDPKIGQATRGDKILASTVDRMSKELKKVSPELDRLDADHKVLRDNFNDLQSEFSLSGKANADTIWKKLIEPFKADGIEANDKLRLAKQLDKELGGKLMPIVMGHITKPLIGQAAASKFLQGGAAGGALASAVGLGSLPLTALMFAPVFASMSPRALQFAAKLLGKAEGNKLLQMARHAGKLGTQATTGAALGLGAADRFNERGEDILTQLGRVQR